MKRLIIILATVIFFGISASAQCWKIVDYIENGDDDGNNFVVVKNRCQDEQTFTILFYENESGEWKSIESPTIYFGGTVTFNIGSSTKYEMAD
jgi:hypothetical protein